MIKVRDRGLHHFTIYHEQSYYLDLEIFSDVKKEVGTITSWQLQSNTFSGSGEDFMSLLQTLQNLASTCTQKQTHTDEVYIVWVKNLLPIKGFFADYITQNFEDIYIQVLNHIEFRCIVDWNKDLKKASVNYCTAYGQKILDTVFIPNRYFYITPNQIIRRKLQHNVGKYQNILKTINPQTFKDYKFYRSALFGGIVYTPYKCTIEEPIIAYDIVSSYIYALLTQKHVCSKPKIVDPSQYELYEWSENQQSLGIYEISYFCIEPYIKCFKDSKGEKLETGEHTVKLTLTSIDLRLFKIIAEVKSITCEYLEVYKVDYVPKYLRDVLVEEFIKKVQLKPFKNERHAEYCTQKVILNGNYGDTIRVCENESEFKDIYGKPYLAMQWGIWTTSYARFHLFSLASKLRGWLYSDTDSIYCFDNDYNRQLINDYNIQTLNHIKEFCKKFKYKFEDLKTLGQFDLEYEITKFRSFAQKEYCFITSHNEYVVKAAGCEKREWNKKDAEKLFKDSTYQIPVGKRVFPVVDGQHSTYYEIVLENEDAQLFSSMLSM